MVLDDIEAVVAVVEAANAAQFPHLARPAGTPPDPADADARRCAHARFVEHDGPGAWVAASGGRVVGVAESVRRGAFWGLSMLFVHPDFQGRGVGGRLLEAAMSHAGGATRRMILSSPDPRAMRRYFLAGLAMHPSVEITGRADRAAIPGSLPGRRGGEEHLELVAEVEAHLGRTRAEDVAFSLSDERSRLEVVDGVGGRGWAVWRPGRLVMLGATDDQTAAALLWRCLAGSDGQALAYGLTAAQQWAFAVAHAARMSLQVDGALFVDGMAVPGPWIPSGWYF